MTGAACLLVVVAAMAAVADWVAVDRGAKAPEYLAKPLTLALLVGAALAVHPVYPDRRGWFVAALVLSLIGDVFLMLPRDLFVAGLGSFLVAHVAYIVGFRLHGGGVAAVAVSAVLVVTIAVVLARPIVAGVRRRAPELLAPVVVYMTVIAVMVTSAWATASPAAVAGAALFFSSDAMIAWNRFVSARRRLPLAVIVTYHLAQGLLVASLVAH